MKILYQSEEIELPQGADGYALIEKCNLRSPHQSTTLKINGRQKDFYDILHEGDRVDVLHFDDPLGRETFWHTSAHVLAQAILRLYPEALPTIGPPIEQGFYYDFANLEISSSDFSRIEKEMKTIIKENYQPKKYTFHSRDEALLRFADNPYKCELIEQLPEGIEITAYEQGEFFDLCRGPHLPALSKIKALKILKTSGAYWRGNSENEMLTRIYAISFPEKQELQDYLIRVEEAKRRDHRIIGQKLKLFLFSEHAPGMPFLAPNGMYIRDQLLCLWRELHEEAGYQEIQTPLMMDQQLWKQSGHWDNYREHMYTSAIDDRIFAVKPMNCPGCMLFYQSERHSYRSLPLRIAEIGTVHRHEHSGAISGMFRVRCFQQDDAHIFMQPEDIKEEILGVLHLVQRLYGTFGLTYHLELSTRPEKNTVGSDADWEYTTRALKEALDASQHPYKINEGDGAFYGPKIDLHIRDAIGRTWQCGTIQLDMSLPERFSLIYVDKNGLEQRPIMIHRALYGSIERFFGIIIEHFAGKLPLWLNPMPIRIIPVSDRHASYAQSIREKIRHLTPLRCVVDDSNESVSKKIRSAQLDQVNYMLIVGDQETTNSSATLRTRDNVVHGEIKIENFIQQATEEYRNRI